MQKPKFLANELRRIIFPDCKTLLDVGCGDNSVVQFFNQKLKKSVGIDLFEKSIEKAKSKGIHNTYIKDNVLNIDKYFKPGSFDCVISIDVIEHLEKKLALELIKKMQVVAKKYVVIQTTNGYLKQGPEGNNPYQIHRCGFTAGELRKMGYKVMGMDGPKFLRSECAKIKFKPKILFSILANILDPIYRFFPEASFNLLAYDKRFN
ncbi:MAG: class I SAM-dependent methyltransferase [bacterium]|nr:class I SAM-dependent methyltransferase [bacterium]